MKTVSFIRFFSILLLWSISFHAYAQQWYRVELVVFEQLDTIADEQWPIMTNKSAAPLTPNMSTDRIEPSEYKSLLKAASRLNSSPHYKVHYHKSWNQPIMTKSRAQAINVQSANGVISGSIKLFKGTYLHVNLDLWLMENSNSANSWSDVTPDGENFDAVRNPNLVESRRVRSKKLYFFDHPKMGALLQLTPLEKQN